MKRSIYLLLMTMMLSCSLKQKFITNQERYYVSIEQNILPGEQCHIFTLNDNELVINEKSYSGTSSLGRKVFKSKISDLERLHSIHEAIDSLWSLDAEYISPQLDGMVWRIDLKKEGVTKTVRIENQRVKAVTILFELINYHIPSDRPQLVSYFIDAQ